MFCMDSTKLNIKIQKILMSELLKLNKPYWMRKMKNQKLRLKKNKKLKNKIKSNLNKYSVIRNSSSRILLKNNWKVSLMREIKLSLHQKCPH